MALMEVMYGRDMCINNCGRWAVFDPDGEEPEWWCPLCYNAEEVVCIKGWWRQHMASLAPRSSLQTLLDAPDISEIVSCFVVLRPTKYTNCCRCDDWNAFPCVNSWFDDGWVCPDFWHDRNRHQ